MMAMTTHTKWALTHSSSKYLSTFVVCWESSFLMWLLLAQRRTKLNTIFKQVVQEATIENECLSHTKWSPRNIKLFITIDHHQQKKYALLTLNRKNYEQYSQEKNLQPLKIPRTHVSLFSFIYEGGGTM